MVDKPKEESPKCSGITPSKKEESLIFPSQNVVE